MDQASYEERLFQRTVREHSDDHIHTNTRPQLRLVPDGPIDTQPTDVWWYLEIALEDITAHNHRWYSSDYHIRIPASRPNQTPATQATTLRVFLRDDECITEITATIIDNSNKTLAHQQFETTTRHAATLDTGLSVIQSIWPLFEYSEVYLAQTTHARDVQPQVHRPGSGRVPT